MALEYTLLGASGRIRTTLLYTTGHNPLQRVRGGWRLDRGGMSLIKHIFSVDSEYRAAMDFTSGPSTFHNAEVLVFERDGFSPYDDCFVYEFRARASGKVKLWI